MFAQKLSTPLKILLAVDSSSHSAAAVNLMSHISWPQGTVVHVLALVPERLPVMDTALQARERLDEVLEVMRWRNWAAARILTDEVVAKLQYLNIEVEAEICEGRPIDIILNQGQALAVDLIVIGAKGFSPSDDFQLGATAHKLTNYSDYSVLIVRPSVQVRPLSTILVVDESPETWQALEFLCALSLPQWAKVTALTIVSQDQQLVTPASARGKMRAILPPKLADSLSRVENRLHQGGSQVRRIIRTGQPEEQILSIAGQQNASLIVLGTALQSPGAAGWESTTTHQVVKYAPCSVLSIRGALAAIKQREPKIINRSDQISPSTLTPVPEPLLNR